MNAAASESTPQNRQLHLPMFLRHEIEAVEQAQRQSDLRRGKSLKKSGSPKTFKVEVVSAAEDLFDAIDDRLLDMPLVGAEEGNELNCEIDPLRVEIVEMLDAADVPESEWSDAAVEELHEAVLHYSLKLLQARGNGAEKKEVLQWIFAPPTMVALVHDQQMQPVEVFLPQNATPFSFEQCCRICGYSSERLMDGLVPILKEIGLGNVFKELFDGNKTDCPTAVQRAKDLRADGST